jgi:hypothetical protein
MTNAELHTDQEEMWTTLFDENHADLAIVAEMLLRRRLSPEAVLRKALTDLEGSPGEEALEQGVRAVAEAAAQYNRETANKPIQPKTSVPPLFNRLILLILALFWTNGMSVIRALHTGWVIGGFNGANARTLLRPLDRKDVSASYESLLP